MNKRAKRGGGLCGEGSG
jgi:hypothetical protein